MGLEQNNEQHYREVVDKYVDPAVTYQMTTRDYVVRPDATRTGPITIYLPPVADAKGRFYSILVRSANTTDTVTIADKDDSEEWARDIVLNDDGQALLLYSDGLKWMLRTFAEIDVSGRARFDNEIKHHFHNVETNQYAYQLRTETLLATTQFFGMDCEVHQAISRTADGVQGLSMTARLKAAMTMSGTSSLIPIRGNLDIDGTINGSGLFAAGYFVVSAGGTFTALSHLSSLWVDSQQEGVVGGNHELIYMTNNGASVMDQAIFVYGGNKISKLFAFDTCGTMISAKTDADVAYAHYRKIECTVDGLTGHVFIEMDA